MRFGTNLTVGTIEANPLPDRGSSLSCIPECISSLVLPIKASEVGSAIRSRGCQNRLLSSLIILYFHIEGTPRRSRAVVELVKGRYTLET